MAPKAVVLAGDIGGTKSNLGLFEVAGGLPGPLRSAKYPSADYPGLAPLLEEFLGNDAVLVRAACFGVPGPVVENRTETTNLAWVLDGGALSPLIGGHAVVLINDLVATAERIIGRTPMTVQPAMPLQDRAMLSVPARGGIRPAVSLRASRAA